MNVKETLAQKEAQGIISEVQKPTPGMVVVNKKNGGVCVSVCVRACVRACAKD